MYSDETNERNQMTMTNTVPVIHYQQINVIQTPRARLLIVIGVQLVRIELSNTGFISLFRRSYVFWL